MSELCDCNELLSHGRKSAWQASRTESSQQQVKLLHKAQLRC